jgi:hypothetical protein
LTASRAAPLICPLSSKRIVDAKAQFRSLAEPWADTGTSTGRLMIAVLGGLAGATLKDLARSYNVSLTTISRLTPSRRA